MGKDVPRARWPRLMGRETAAEYCDMSTTFFADTIGSMVQPHRFRKRVVWDREDIDYYIESGRPRPRGALAGTSEAPEEASDDAEKWTKFLD